MSQANALAVQVAAEFLVNQELSMNGQCAPVRVLAKAAGPMREQLDKRETGQAKQVG